MIRLTRLPAERRGQPGRILTSGAIELDLDDTNEGWGQVCQAARAAGLAPPRVDRQTGEFVFSPNPEAEQQWAVNIDTQMHQRDLARRHLAKIEGLLVRLGVDPASQSVPPAPAPPLAAEPDPRATDIDDAQAISIAAVMASARAKREWFRLAVCTLAVEGRAALGSLKLPAKIRDRVEAMSEVEAGELCQQWVAESARE